MELDKNTSMYIYLLFVHAAAYVILTIASNLLFQPSGPLQFPCYFGVIVLRRANESCTAGFVARCAMQGSQNRVCFAWFELCASSDVV